MTYITEATADKGADPRVPVTLLTGFLGAGKTTLLNRILQEASSGKIAVIVNEFGEAGLDHDLIEAVEDEVMLMQSGCLCCSIRGDLSQTIADLIARRKTGAVSFERLVIETTGMADTGPILKTLLVDPSLAHTTRMDGVVTVVDAVNGPDTLDAHFEAVSQVAMADLLLLSKTDQVSDKQIEALKRRLRDLNATAPIQLVAQGTFDPAKLWGLSALRGDATRTDAVAWTSPPAKAPVGQLSNLAENPQKTHTHSRHDDRITSQSIVLDQPLQDKVFDLWLDTLIALKGPDILRVKGVVFLEGIDTPFVFHGVQHIFNPPVPLTNWNSADRRSRIVVIGRDLTQPELQASFDMLSTDQPKVQLLKMGTHDHD